MFFFFSLSLTDSLNKSGDNSIRANGMGGLPAPGSVRRMVALYDYDPHELSPNVDAEVGRG